MMLNEKRDVILSYYFLRTAAMNVKHEKKDLILSFYFMRTAAMNVK